MQKRTLLTLLSLCMLLLIGCQSRTGGVVVQFTSAAGASSPKIQSEVVATDASRQLGLMYRKSLGEHEGMLFVFPNEQPLSFWMRNTYVELDMIYMDKGFKVVSIIHRAVPLTETPRPSGKPAQYVLEVPGGSAKKWGIDAGWTAVVTGELPTATNETPPSAIVETP